MPPEGVRTSCMVWSLSPVDYCSRATPRNAERGLCGVKTFFLPVYGCYMTAPGRKNAPREDPIAPQGNRVKEQTLNLLRSL